jgi:hypothetical protein
MLDALRFVAAAVAKKDYVQDLQHFRIKDGRVTGFNGVVALSSDIDVDLDIHPNAAKMLAAIKACPGTIALNMTPAGRLAVKSEKFKSFVECLPQESAQFPEPEGEAIDLGENFMPGIKALAPAMGIDASRIWAMGIKLQNQSMFATNNVMLVEYWHGTDIPLDVVIPDVCVKELLRINENPTRVQVNDRCITFWFGEKRWLRSQLVEPTGWPMAKMDQVLSMSDGEQLAYPEGFFEAIDTLKPFLADSGTVYVSPDKVSTAKDEGEGTSVDVSIPGVTEMQAYHHRQLTLLGEISQTIDWTAYPAPCMFRGNRLRGALVGQRI